MSARNAAITAAVVAAAVVLLVGTGLGWFGSSASAPASPLTVHAQLAPASVLYGDEVAATVTVSGTPSALAGLSIQPTFAPYAPAAPPTVTRTTAGRRETVVYRYGLECLTDACLPIGKPRQIPFPAFGVTAGGKRTTATWPPLLVASRLTAAELAASTPPVRIAFLPPVHYGVSRSTLAALLVAAAALLALAAAVLAHRELAALVRVRRERRPRLSGLALAMAYARDAARRPDPADRRRAAELLAESLRARSPELADAAGELAWSNEPPTPEQTLELVAAVEASDGLE